MINKSMQRRLATKQAIDVSKCRRLGDFYVLDEVIDGKDYCDARKEVWIWSVGRRKSDGVILASTTTILYGNSDFECLWLR